MPLWCRPGIGQVARDRGARRDEHGVVTRAQLSPSDVLADVDVGAEPGALCLHLRDARVDVVLLHLEVRDAVAQQAADAVVALEDGDCVARARQLLGRREARGARADDGDRLAQSGACAITGLDVAVLEGLSMIDTSMFLMVTAGWLMPRTQDVSHGAGQMRPVNSGKLFVA